jgi:Glycosyltransferases, probably involved in cell wall biogenesis
LNINNMIKIENNLSRGPKVSVIIPTYNRRLLLERALKSVLEQSYRDFEVIIVDDGSTDGTFEMLKGYGMTNSDKIKIIRQENRGESAARNAGIGIASGEYIAFQDSNDVWVKNKLEKQIAYMEQNTRFALTYTDISVYRNGVLQFKSRLHEERYGYFKEGEIFLNLLKECFIFVPTVVLRRSCLLSIGGFNQKLFVAQDYDLWLRIATKYPIGFLDEPLSICHYHGNNVTSDALLRCENFVCLFKDLFLNANLWLNALSIIRRRLSQGHYDLAYCFWVTGDYNSARKNFYLSLKFNFIKWKSIVYILVSFFPEKFILVLKQLKKLLSRENYA